MAPKARLIAGVVVAFATVPLTPLAVVTDTLVTVPPGLDDARVLPVIERFAPRLISPILVPVASDPSRRLIAAAVWILS